VIYVFNASPIVLQISVNSVPVGSAVFASPAPSYVPQSILVPYGPTGSYPPPATYPITQPHFVPGPNVLFTTYSSLDPDQPILGLEFTFNFNLSTPVAEDLVLYCFRNSLWVLDQYGTTLQTVPAAPAQNTSTQQPS